MAVAPELTADRPRIAASTVLAVATRHEPPHLELIAHGGLPGVAVAPELTADRQRIAAGTGLAGSARHGPAYLELIAPGGLHGVAVAVRGRGA